MRLKSLSDITFRCFGTEYEAAGRLIEQHRPHTDPRSDTLAPTLIFLYRLFVTIQLGLYICVCVVPRM